MPSDCLARSGLPDRLRRRALPAMLALGLALQTGCGSMVPQPPDTSHQAMLGRVAVQAGSQVPEIELQGFARSKGAGMASGAGTTFAACLGSGSGSCSGSLCAPVVVIWLGVCLAASAVGGAAGAANAPSAAQVREAEATLDPLMRTATIQIALRDQVIAQARAQGAALADPAMAGSDQAQPPGADTVLEVALKRIGTEGGAGTNPPLALVMQAHVRLLRARDGQELFAADYLHSGEQRRLAEWSAEQGAPLQRGLQRGYEALGALIHDNVFLLYPFPDREPHAAGMLAPSFGLRPIEPPTRGTLTGDKLIGKHFEWTTVSSRQPRLRWQEFPRASDLAKAPQEMARVRRVRYDLVIAQAHELAPETIVYQRSGLPAPEHRLEQPLQPGTRYFWTVRARFELDGRERVTEWGSTHFIVRERWTAPSSWSYRFRTP